MSTESLINNIDYNVKMDKNISILSDTTSMLPEDLSYAINVTDIPVSFPEVKENRQDNQSKLFLVIKINVLIFVTSVILLCIIYL